jgi:TIGR00252 family protein
MNKRTVGAQTEERAARYLEKQGYALVARNYRCYCGEIDIVAEDGGAVVFIEVKYRRTAEYGTPEQAVDAHKQARIRRAAMCFLKEQGFSDDTAMRFDVIAMDEREIRLYRDAF